MKVQVTLCTAKTNAKGGVILETRYSQWDTIEVETLKEARAYGEGIVCGLRYHWKSAACTLRFEDGHEEYFT